MTRIAEPQLGFADLELRNQGVHLDPVPAQRGFAAN